jgi:hypothetical protein
MDGASLLPPALCPRPLSCLPLPGKPRRLGGPRPLAPRWRESCQLDDAARLRVEAHMAHRGLLDPRAADELVLGLDTLPGESPESCHLRLWAGGGEALAMDEGGLHRAVELLAAMAEAPSGPALEIRDRPMHAWRGVMLDCSRHFWPMPVVRRVLDELARHGGNRLHLHLTDDQGWRLPLPQRPRLEEIGAWRLEADGSRHGGMYSAMELRALVAHAQDLGVEILPEVDLPGHCGALLAALPELSCGGNAQVVPRAWGCHDALLCLGNPSLPEFLDELLDALTQLFPFSHIHLGGDEVPSQVWGRCPRCRERLRGSGGTDPAALAGIWLKLTEARLAAHGRHGAYWDEALDHVQDGESLIFAWRGPEAVTRALVKGHPTVACPLHPCYLDFYPGLDEGQPMAIGGFNHWKHLRAFDPLRLAREGVAGRELLLGSQGNLWAEYVDSEERLMERLQPRLAALMEALWRGPEEDAGDDAFARRLPQLTRAAWSRGWRSLVDAPRPLHTPLALPGKELRVAFELWPEGRLECSTDGHNWAALPNQAEVDLPPHVDSLRLQLRQLLPHGACSPPLPLHVRREKPWPSGKDESAAAVDATSCRWLCAPHADWRLVALDPAWAAWTCDSLDWPREQVEARLAMPVMEIPPPAQPWSQEPATPPLPEIVPWGMCLGLSRETLWAVPRTGRWRLVLRSSSLARLWVDGRLVLDQDGFRPGGTLADWIPLEEGPHHLRLDWLNSRGGDCQLERLCED